MCAVSIAAVVLAAGASTRLGQSKQTLQIRGESLVARAARIASEVGCAPVIVVVNATVDVGHSLQGCGCLVIVNEDAAEGMASSIRCGIKAALELKASGALVMTCDQPGVDAAHLHALSAESERMTGSEYAGRVGVPAYFPASSFAALLALRGDAGARELLRGARSIVQEALALDIDTEADFRAALKIF